jgi:hypothetical protein
MATSLAAARNEEQLAASLPVARTEQPLGAPLPAARTEQPEQAGAGESKDAPESRPEKAPDAQASSAAAAEKELDSLIPFCGLGCCNLFAEPTDCRTVKCSCYGDCTLFEPR